MNEGDAASWKEQLLEDVMAKELFDLGTWDMFEKNLRKMCSNLTTHQEMPSKK